MLNYSKGAPALYLQIKEQLRAELTSGKYELGSYIPTENALEITYGVSKITIRKAIQDLEDEGYLVKKKGKGTIVVQNHYFNKLAKTKSYSRKLEELGIKLAKKNAKCEVLDAENISEIATIMSGKVNCVKRLIYADGRILTYLESYIPFSEELKIDFSLADWSLYQTLSDLGVTVERSEDFFSVELASLETASILQIAIGTPILKRVRKAYDMSGKIIEYSIGYYLTAKMPYIVEMEK
ncbi:MAG: GntR family transcriptional regulator [Culicoidibacterales bacterium]